MTAADQYVTDQLGAYAGLHAEFHARVGSAMSGMVEAWQKDMGQALDGPRFVPAMAFQGVVTGGAVTIANSELGPKTGYVWVVKRISAAGFSATVSTDQLGIYKGQPAPQNLVGILTFADPVFLPGTSTMVLNYGDFVTAQNIAAWTGGETLVTLSMDVIIVQQRGLAKFLGTV
jgi:hypothetical protein